MNNYKYIKIVTICEMVNNINPNLESYLHTKRYGFHSIINRSVTSLGSFSQRHMVVIKLTHNMKHVLHAISGHTDYYVTDRRYSTHDHSSHNTVSVICEFKVQY